MEYRALGQSGLPASAVGLGTWAIGGWAWGGTDRRDAVAAVQAALDHGINLIDTAPAYGLGLSEELVGTAIQHRRDEVLLATKCGLVWHTQQGDKFFEQGGRPVHRFLGANSVVHEVEASLSRLRTDRIDLLQTHWQDHTTPIVETMAALLQLKAQGKIRAIGVSNVNLAQLQEYTKCGPIDSVQQKYSLLDRDDEAELLPYCRAHGIAYLAYSPLSRGLLSGAMSADREFGAGDSRASIARFSAENRSRVNRALESLRPLAERHGVSLSQLVIAWTLRQPGVSHVLVGARSAAQAVTNAGAGEVTLTTAELEQIAQVAGGELADLA